MTGTKQDIVMFLMDQDSKTVWDLTEHKEKRRLNQNSYYWTLAGKVAEKTHVSVWEIHNRNLRDLGLLDRMENGEFKISLIPDTDAGEREALNDPIVHLLPTSKTLQANNGQIFRFYVRLRESKTFTVSEFSALTDLMVQEAQAQDIEVLTPNELEHIRELERNHERKHNSGE